MKLLKFLEPYVWMATGCRFNLAIVSAVVGSNASSDAADAQVEATKEANRGNKEINAQNLAFAREALQKGIDFQNQSWDKQLALQKPYRDIGVNSQNQLARMLGVTPKNQLQGYTMGDFSSGNAQAKQLQALNSQLAALDSKYGSLSKAPAAIAAIDTSANPWWYQQAGGKAELARHQAAVDAQAKAQVGTKAQLAQLDAQRNALKGQIGKLQPIVSKGYSDWLNQKAMPSDYGSLMKDFSLQDFHNDPGYEWRKQQGEMGLDRAAAASGRVGSGRYLKDAMTFNQGLADQSYQDAFNRFQTNRANKLNPLQSLGGVGQTSANTLTSGAVNQGNQNQGGYQNYANNAIGSNSAYGSMLNQNTLGAGNATASGYMGGANAVSQGIGNALQFGGMLLGKKGF